MRYTQLRIARTYNTDHYTSQRFELETDIEEDDDAGVILGVVYNELDGFARSAMHAQGLAYIIEQGGQVRLGRMRDAVEEDDDAIPF